MNIEWTLCSERMPPDDYGIKLIVKDGEFDCLISSGGMVSDYASFLDVSEVIWTEFTKEKWEFLNR